MARRASRTIGSVAFAAALALGVELVLARGEPATLVLLRVVDPEGRPVAAEALDFEATERDAQMITVWLPRLETLGDGRARIDLDELAPGAELALSITLRSRGANGLGARIDVSRLGSGEHDLGVVLLGPPPRLVAGRVLDAEGAPVAAATVQLERRWMGPAAGPATWNPATGVRARCDGEGHFELSGWLGTDELRVAAQARDLAPTTVEVRAGATGVEIRLGATGAFEGSVLIDARCDPGAVSIECAPRTNPTAGISAPVDPDGGFSARGLPAGEYTVRFRAQHDAEPLLAIDGVAIRGGVVANDPRLRGVDLRGRLRCIAIRVSALRGGAIPWFVYGVRGAGSPSDPLPFSAAGDFAVTTGARAVDLRVFAPGYRTVRIDALDSDRAIELVPGLPVRIVLDGGVPALPDGLSLHASLEPLSVELPAARFAVVLFDARGEALVPACDAGELRIALGVRRAATGEDFSILVRIATPDTIRVAEREGEQRATVRLDLDALRRALERIARGG